MELDGLSNGGQGGIASMKTNGNTATTPTPGATVHLGEAAQAALAYLTSHLRTHSISLKVQTSRGNYLRTLAVRTEQVDFGSVRSLGGGGEKSMDDLILKAAIWQDEHWVDRSSILSSMKAGLNKPTAAAVVGEGVGGGDVQDATKVVLLTLDRNRESFCCRVCDGR
jgi:hypothetical protein